MPSAAATITLHTRRIEVDTLVVKVASRCNLNCDYCYVYHAKDLSWRDMPAVMPGSAMSALVDQVAALYETQQTRPQVVFHGGEPLLAGIRRLRPLIAALVDRVPLVDLSIQTNGTIYTPALERLLLDYRSNLSFSVSVDGFREENDRHRLSEDGRSAYAKIENTLKQARLAGVLDNILVVIDIDNDPGRIYDFMVAAGASSYNIILRDGDHFSLPAGKDSVESTDAGRWLWALFSLYSSRTPPFRIKFFDDIAVSLLRKHRSVPKPKPTFSYCTMTVDTNGEIKHIDTLRTNGNGADRIGAENVLTHSIGGVVSSFITLEHLARAHTLSDRCTKCNYLDVCGGGYLPHRFGNNGYANPSIYCADYLYLFDKMATAICR